MKINGSCHCGKVTFEVLEPLSDVYQCYCDTCRKLSGAAYSVVSYVPAKNFKITKSDAPLHIYESSPGKERHYCSNCCTPIFVQLKSKPDTVRIRLGVLDSESNVNIVGHVWVSEKPHWCKITDSLPQFEERSTRA